MLDMHWWITWALPTQAECLSLGGILVFHFVYMTHVVTRLDTMFLDIVCWPVAVVCSSGLYLSVFVNRVVGGL
jgi:hypothetical protein